MVVYHQRRHRLDLSDLDPTLQHHCLVSYGHTQLAIVQIYEVRLCCHRVSEGIFVDFHLIDLTTGDFLTQDSMWVLTAVLYIDGTLFITG